MGPSASVPVVAGTMMPSLRNWPVMAPLEEKKYREYDPGGTPGMEKSPVALAFTK